MIAFLRRLFGVKRHATVYVFVRTEFDGRHVAEAVHRELLRRHRRGEGGLL